jgi:hypothetical protein
VVASAARTRCCRLRALDPSVAENDTLQLLHKCKHGECSREKTPRQCRRRRRRSSRSSRSTSYRSSSLDERARAPPPAGVTCSTWQSFMKLGTNRCSHW